ncbi:MAG: dependent oxidoreductase, partial [Paenibacillus sp.]|nr:dependent oxidoreductase [Paenibacillus sp.]
MRIKRNTAIAASVLVLILLFAGWAAVAMKGGNKSGDEGGKIAEQAVTPEQTKTQTPPPNETKPAPPPEPVVPTEKVDVVMFGSEMEGLYLVRAAADEGLKVKVL